MSELEAVNRYILERVQEGSFDGDSAVSLLRKLNGVDPSKDIAIVGMSCRFPRADDYDEYWRNIINKVGVIGTFPEDRARDTGHAMKLKAGWLEHIGDFDAAFFRISPKEALSMHPEQRIFLEAAWTCLEDAGYCGPSVEGSNVGVFVGVDHSYPMDYVAHDAAHSLLDMTGSMSSVMASRIAFVLDLRGPNMVLDTACSSGLVAVHQACLSIRAGESDLAIAGGLHLLSDTDASFDGVESTSGVLASFDRNSQGTVWGEGLGLVVLKAADRAIADNDHIYAIIRGSAVNNDGRSNGITAPKASTQADVILRAWRDAGIDPEHLSYVEAHATGTVLGDPIEVDGLTTAFARHTSRKQFCALGSVKPNLGHGVSAASMSSLLKVLLAMRARKLPPNINFEEPNPYIAFHESPLYVSDVLQPWAPNGPRLLAAVSSFGFGRTNAHVVLEEAPAREVPADPAPAPDPDRLVFALSARTEAALWHYVRAVHDHLVDHPQLSPADVCFTLAVGRMQFEHRLAFEFAGRAELLARLAELSSPDRHLAGVHVGRHRVISANMIAQDAHDLTGTQQRALTAQAAALLTGDPLGAEARSDLCDLFVGGASVDWAATFSTPGLGRVPLPTYPFQRKHFWIEPEPESPTLVEPDALHPLVEKLLARSRSEDIYGTRFEVGKQWILTEHVINGHNVIPGTAFLEMMHAACAQTCGQPQLELADVVFHASATVRPDEPLDVQITVRTVEGAFEIEILSEDPDLGWVTHATGRGIPLAATRPPTVLDPAITRARCDEVLPFDLSKEYGGFRFGPRWRNVTEIVYNSRQEIFTDLVMAEDFLADLDEYFLHPALLDNAINIGSEFLIQNVTHTMFLPFACKSIKIYAPLPQSFVSVQVIRNPIKNDMGAASIDVTLVDAAGRVILTLEKYSLKRVNHELFVNSVYHRVGFKETPLPPTAVGGSAHSLAASTVLLVADQPDQGLVIAEASRQLEAVGAKVVVAATDADLDLVFAALGDDRLGAVVHAGAFGRRSPRSAQDLTSQVDAGTHSLVRLAQALARRESAGQLPLLVLVDAVSPVGGNADVQNPVGACVGALAKVLSAEHARLTVGCLDTQAEVVPSLVDEIAALQDGALVVWRGAHRYAAVVEEAQLETFPAEPVEIRDTGVYLITGGLDGIAAAIIEGLTTEERHPRFAVLSRTPIPDDPAEWDAAANAGPPAVAARVARLRELRERGIDVHPVAGDVADLDGMRQVCAQLRDRFGAINGVVHGAGLPAGSYVVNTSLEEFDRVLRPKVAGTWVLEEVTREDDLAFFLLSSSLISVFGPAGQGAYAAANAYLNATASMRRARGQKSTAIAWSVWSESGMATAYDADQVRGVFHSLTDAAGAEAAVGVLDRDVAVLLVGGLDHGRIREAGGAIGLPLSDALRAKLRMGQPRKQERPRRREVVVLSSEPLTDTEVAVANIWGTLQALDEVSVHEPFSDSGGDSLVISQFVNALNEHQQTVLDISDVYANPTVRQLAGYLDGRQAPPLPEAAPTAERVLTVEEIMDGLDRGELSMDEAQQLLERVE